MQPKAGYCPRRRELPRTRTPSDHTILLYPLCHLRLTLTCTRIMSSADGEVDGFEERLRQRTAKATQAHELDTVPANPGLRPRGKIPNTPLAASTISFLLGSLFTLGSITFVSGGIDRFWWSTYQLGFYIAAWAAFHWAEFAVTAGWNRDKCSIDCTLPPELH